MAFLLVILHYPGCFPLPQFGVLGPRGRSLTDGYVAKSVPLILFSVHSGLDSCHLPDAVYSADGLL